MDSSRLPIRARYGFLYYALSGNPIPKGAETYQNFDLLIKIRDSLVHHKSYAGDSFPESIQKIFEQLIVKKIIDSSEKNRPYSEWARTLDRSEVLNDWSMSAASGIMKLIADVTPQTEANLVHTVLKTMYSES